MSRPTLRTAVLAALALLMPSAARAAFTNFESGQVRPLALSPSQGLLFACNTPDNRLAVYTVGAGGLTLATEVPVGLEPVAVATRALSGGRVEAWVVNHLSDSLSIVEVDPANLATARVTRTLLVGDEPRDIVFAGPGGTRAFITAAHRGQNRPGDPQLTTEGIGRADVWVFEATALGTALGGTPLTILTLFGDTPRALATDGTTVYAAVFHSGNRTTSITESVVATNGGMPPNPTGSTPNPPSTGLIVHFNANGRWEDEIGRDWSGQVAFSLPDQDVFVIDSTLPTPAQTGSISGVGTVLFNMAVRPSSGGKLYVTNTEARNHIRFEPVLRGHITESRITVINGTTPTPVHLNPHINYNVVPGPQSEVDNSLAFPTDLVFTPNGQTVFVAGIGSGKVGVFSTTSLEAGNVNPRQLLTVGLAPSGLAYDSVRERLYVLNRIDRTISIVSNASQGSRAVTGSVSLRFDAEPPTVRNGRKFLYDAQGTSGHGDSACFSCHIYGDFDSLAWDLGDPFGSVVGNTNPFRLGAGSPFHPIKGPMTTQTLRGMADNGPMHWRGDRTGGGANALNEDLAFKAFNPAFVGLLGRGSQLDGSAMQAFTDFVLTVVFPPNPIRVLSDTLTGAPLAGSTFFQNTPVDGGRTCFFCHRLPVGSDGLSSSEGEPQEFKIAHLRNLYQKIGMFGFPGQSNTGDQVRGFGFLHDGSIDTVNTFLSAGVFDFPDNTTRRNVEQFLLGFDTGLRPMVGQQVTVTPTTVNDGTVIQRITAMIAQDNAGACDLVVKGTLGGVARGAVFVGGANNNFQPDRNADPVIANNALRALAGTAGQELTYTCVPPGNGTRIGVDRDEDGFFDRTEIDAATDPADRLSFPGSAPTTTTSTTVPVGGTVRVQVTFMTLKDGSVAGDPGKRKLSFTSSTKKDPTGNRIVAPVPGSAGDPTLTGATLRVYNPITHADDVTVPLVSGPDGSWSTNGSGTLFKWKGLNPDGPVKWVILKADKLSIRAGKSLWAYTLGEATQGSVALRFQAGGGPVWCAQAGQSSFPPKIDMQDKFIAMKKTPAPAVCP